MNKEQYHLYLQSDKWRKVAQRRLEIDGHACQMCGSRGTQLNPLQVHHLSYRHIGNEGAGDYVFTDLVTVCQSCHRGIHTLMNRITAPNGRRGWKDSLNYADHVLEGVEGK